MKQHAAFQSHRTRSAGFLSYDGQRPVLQKVQNLASDAKEKERFAPGGPPNKRPTPPKKETASTRSPSLDQEIFRERGELDLLRHISSFFFGVVLAIKSSGFFNKQKARWSGMTS